MHIPLATLALTLALSLAGMASADVYKCPDAAGRQHYQNRPCEGDDEPAIISPGPGSRYVGPPVKPQAPTKATDCVEIKSLDAKLVPGTQFSPSMAWKVIVTNRCQTSFTSIVRFQALDREGYEVAFDLTKLFIMPADESVATSHLPLTQAQSRRAYDTKALLTFPTGTPAGDGSVSPLRP